MLQMYFMNARVVVQLIYGYSTECMVRTTVMGMKLQPYPVRHVCTCTRVTCVASFAL